MFFFPTENGSFPTERTEKRRPLIFGLDMFAEVSNKRKKIRSSMINKARLRKRKCLWTFFHHWVGISESFRNHSTSSLRRIFVHKSGEIEIVEEMVEVEVEGILQDSRIFGNGVVELFEDSVQIEVEIEIELIRCGSFERRRGERREGINSLGIVLTTFRGIAQHIVSFGHGTKCRFRFGISIFIGMIFQC